MVRLPAKRPESLSRAWFAQSPLAREPPPIILLPLGRFCCRSRRRRERSLAPSYKLSLPLARESGVWGLP
jgi:hypothetical protein